MRRILALAVLCLPAFAQQDIYTISHDATLTAENTAVSIQLPTNAAAQVEVNDVAVQCSATCNLRFERNGAAATANGSTIVALTPQALNPESVPAATLASPKVVAFAGSGIPIGTVVSPVNGWTLPAGAFIPFGSGRVMSTGSGGIAANGGINYIIRLMGTYTGTIKVFVVAGVRR